MCHIKRKNYCIFRLVTRQESFHLDICVECRSAEFARTDEKIVAAGLDAFVTFQPKFNYLGNLRVVILY